MVNPMGNTNTASFGDIAHNASAAEASSANWGMLGQMHEHQAMSSERINEIRDRRRRGAARAFAQSAQRGARWEAGSVSTTPQQFGQMSCVICMEALVGEQDDRIVTLSCTHTFHLTCVE